MAGGTQSPRKPGRPSSGGRAISARSRTGDRHLAWCDGHWSGDRVSRLCAKAYTDVAEPLPLIAGFRDVTPADGDLVYAVAVLVHALGPVDWAEPPPRGYTAHLVGPAPLTTDHFEVTI